MKKILLYCVVEENIKWSEVKDSYKNNPIQRYSDIKEQKSFICFLDELNKKFTEVYLKLDSQENFASKGFERMFLYQGGKKFDLKSQEIIVDVVFNRSREIYFQLFCDRVCNSFEFKSVSKDKYLSYLFLKEYCPKTFLIDDQIETRLNEIVSLDKIILKPRNLSGGKGIEVFNLLEVVDRKAFIEDLISKYPNFLIQEFKETKKGIPGIINSRHDIRVQVCDKKISFVYIRVPKDEEYLANVSQGGSVAKYVDFEIFEDFIQKKIREIIKKISTKYPNSHYAIDFGISESKEFFLYEINCNMGWPDYDEVIKPWARDLSEMLFKMA